MSFYSKRASEGGSLITFLVVGVVLAALVVGGIYTVSRHQDNPQPAPSSSTTSSKSPTKSIAASNTVHPVPSKSSKAPPPAQSSPVPHAPIVKNSPRQAPLPATGPTEDMMSVIMLGMLVGFAIAFVRSTRELRLAQQVD